VREWTPSDHHSSDDDKVAAGGKQTAAGGPSGDDVNRLVDLAWRQQCSSCHGSTGKGDGQFGPMVRAPDLTRDDWQESVSDVEIATAIKKGKGKMPSFDVPDSVVQGLVARVRAARGR
jgi:cytochrome c oxidase cbb3-type subunit 3